MSVFLDNHGRRSDYEPEAFRGGAKLPGRKAPPRRRADDAPLWGFSYDRAEGFIHLLLAFTLVGGAAAMLWTLVPPVTDKRGAAAKVAVAVPAPQPQPQPQTRPEKPAPAMQNVEKTSEIQADPAHAPISAPAQATAASLAPIAAAPAPLAPPPAEMRARLGAPVTEPAREMAMAEASPEPEPAAVAAPAPAARELAPPPAQRTAEEPRADAPESDRSRMAHCYVKLSGRVTISGTCRVQRTDDGLIFQLPGKPLEIAHAHGRVWTATLGGRTIGKVYKSGSCWGGRGFYACQNG
ncbi:MAG: hypothetical protein ACR652_22220 [Methylocystis sp.]|uniref:hypothetical protein n=1 Tax=Methylocystis sp. TaxID=1911079 RepID=UPI003DA6448A